MPALPNVSQSIRDPGIPSGGAIGMPAVFIGPSKGGVPNTLKWYDSPGSVVDEHIDGPVVDMAVQVLEEVGGPVGVLCSAASVEADNSAITKVGSHAGPTITVAGTSRYDHFVEVEITLGGALGTARFRYNLDGFSGATDSQKTWTDPITIPSGGEYAIPHSDLVLTFPSGTYVVGHRYTWTSECAAMNATDLAAAFDVLAEAKRPYRYVALATGANLGNAAAHATLCAALQAELNSFANAGVNRRGMMKAAATADAAGVAAAYAAVTAARVLVLYSDVASLAGVRFPGYARPRGSALGPLACRAAGVQPSTDLKRVESGPLPRVLEVFHDERTSPTGLDDLYITTLRSWQRLGTPFVVQGRLKAAVGSDFRLWPRGIVLDMGCDIVFDELTRLIGKGMRFNQGPVVGDTGLNRDGLVVGALDPGEIERYEDQINERLSDEIMRPTNEEGVAGHATAMQFRLDPAHNVATTETIVGSLNGVPLVYPSHAHNSAGWGTSL